ncbi:hypothetical protein HanXRQr2_Chr01g0000551 [Helianthus annuus]|uniref:Uncharacterized protein n=1 Tax=Helianthus annuus TaxID=4232 RepID=A0A251VJE9_HELAN|nr:hypothetical protein HanXRQr2_Chr01g0000551 [Helianthus annuus]
MFSFNETPPLVNNRLYFKNIIASDGVPVATVTGSGADLTLFSRASTPMFFFFLTLKIPTVTKQGRSAGVQTLSSPLCPGLVIKDLFWAKQLLGW